MKSLTIALLLVVAWALPAPAQQLQLEIHDGRVTLDAVNVPARQILDQWARIGGTTIIGEEKITGAPLTLKLVNMPERQALDIVLRNVAGFMAAPRAANAAPGASTYDRILIMATSSAPAPAPANARGGNGNFGINGGPRRVPPRPPNLPPAAGDEPPADIDDQPVQDDQMDPPVFTFPAPPGSVTPGDNPPVFVPVPNGAAPGTPGAVSPVISLQPGPNGPTIYNFVPDPNGTAPQQAPPAQGGFAVIGSPTPGVVQVPQTPPPPPPGQRPPG